MSAPQTIAELLRHELTTADITPTEIARAAGILQPPLWRFLNEGTDPKLAVAERLLHYFGYVLVKADDAKGLNAFRPSAAPETRRTAQRARNAAAKAAKAKSSGTRRKGAASTKRSAPKRTASLRRRPSRKV